MDWRWLARVGGIPSFATGGSLFQLWRRCSFKSETGESGATSSRSGFSTCLIIGPYNKRVSSTVTIASIGRIELSPRTRGIGNWLEFWNEMRRAPKPTLIYLSRFQRRSDAICGEKAFARSATKTKNTMWNDVIGFYFCHIADDLQALIFERCHSSIA